MVKAAAKAGAAKSPKVKKVSPYNNFMKEEIAKLKKAQPKLAHKEAFKMAAANVCRHVHRKRRTHLLTSF